MTVIANLLAASRGCEVTDTLGCNLVAVKMEMSELWDRPSRNQFDQARQMCVGPAKFMVSYRRGIPKPLLKRERVERDDDLDVCLLAGEGFRLQKI